MPEWYAALVMTIFGLLFGSFANVVIWRLPRGESLASPGSHCPFCDHPVRWYDNIPVISWLFLRGTCRDCGEAIAIRYPLVEFASGALFLLAALVWGVSFRAVFGAILFWFLLVLSAIDLDTMRLPNPLVTALGLVGIVGTLVSEVTGTVTLPLTMGAEDALSPWLSAAFGVLLGGGLSAAIALAYRLIAGRSGFGMGDIKLLGALGIFLGPYVLLSFFIGSLLGSVGAVLMARGRGLSGKKIPFGPWLAAGAVVTAVVGPPLVSWYLSLVGIS